MTRPPVRVLLVDHAPIIGGVEHMLRELLTALDRSCITPTVVTDSHSPMRGQFGADEIALPLTQLKHNPLALSALLAAGVQLAQAARQTQAQVIHTFTARTHLIGAVAGPLAGVPLAWRLNDDTLTSAPARLVGRIPHRIVTVSAHLREHYRRILRTTDHIPDGVPVIAPLSRLEARHALGLPNEVMIITLAARMVRWKGHSVFLRALAALTKEWPTLHGLLIGGYSTSDNVPGSLGGGEPYQHELLTLARKLGLTGQVTFTGQVAEIAPYFAASDIIIHTSLLPEPFGRVLIEAMMVGRPVIAADAGGPREIVRPGETGLLTSPGDPAALAQAITMLLSDADRRMQMGRAARDRAVTEYGLPQMANRFTRLWLNMADR